MKVDLSDVLLAIFIVLKLTGNITWSWVWVLSPLWVSLIVYILLIGGMWIDIHRKRS